MEEPRPPANPATNPPKAASVAAWVGLEDMRQRLGLGAPERPRIGRDGRFELISCLGHGGMGEVYLALDTVLEREVALKIVAGRFRHSPHQRLRLLREAKTLAKLAHPNVLEVYDVDTADSGELVVAVAYVRGATLERWQAGRPLRKVLAAYLDAGRGLAAAHAAGIIHRDFKPANVLITPDQRVKIIDFGLARISNLEGMTATGMLLGTPEYMAPEQIKGGVIDVRTDLYSLGALTYHALTGRPPFSGETPIALSLAQATEDPIPPSQLRAGLDAAWDAFVLRAMSKSREGRFESADAMRAALPA
ncbi:MAG: serine/threonine protein kinase [Deltaproteobacteria bacterium]|nr:serine/threonine protein kinase [Deltaproteobacteria bacterium]